ncbi:MAG: 5-formyltetrahydrofolate cyclo-ligase [Rhodospirillales bacterium]|nr:5-formyltetrahydrofolate cyclo-ligase [Rhodospirillales bacterium]MSP79498.1 5-formyltetrahydrofolate cyclo-ligase [Rhodospirillales bacterium]
MTLDADKKSVRTEAAERRNAAFAADPGAGEALARRVIERARALGLGPGVAVSAYWPMREEMDARPLMRELARIECVVALPVVMGKGKPLVFRRWRPETVLRSGPFGLSEPNEGDPEVTPRIVFAPLLAFDRRGHRIGWGAGFYDRTLADLRSRGPALAVGVAYAAQELAHVPAGLHDQPLDWIATEREVTRLSGHSRASGGL